MELLDPEFDELELLLELELSDLLDEVPKLPLLNPELDVLLFLSSLDVDLSLVDDELDLSLEELLKLPLLNPLLEDVLLAELFPVDLELLKLPLLNPLFPLDLEELVDLEELDLELLPLLLDLALAVDMLMSILESGNMSTVKPDTIKEKIIAKHKSNFFLLLLIMNTYFHKLIYILYGTVYLLTNYKKTLYKLKNSFKFT